jgi:fatty acid synthase
VEFDPEHTVARPVPDSGDWEVIRKAGTEIRVPRKTKLSRTVGAQIPTGFDPTVWGISPDMAGSIDRWRCGTSSPPSTRSCPRASPRGVDALGAPEPGGQHPGHRHGRHDVDADDVPRQPAGVAKPNDILQEVLPNVVAAHVMQSYVGSYGSMIHPVGACATAAVSVEEGMDKIRLGKAELVVAGGFDDMTLEAVIGFGDMAATADTEMMRSKGISDAKFSRANDRRRLGFLEAQGGGTVLLARGDLALKMVCRCWPWSDTRRASPTVCTRSRRRASVPWAPAVAADSVLARSLAKLGVDPTTSR